MIDTQELWTDGKDGNPVCISVDDRGRSVLADVEIERITQDQFERTIRTEFPDVDFRVWRQMQFWFATGRREGTL